MEDGLADGEFLEDGEEFRVGWRHVFGGHGLMIIPVGRTEWVMKISERMGLQDEGSADAAGLLARGVAES
jgi:hypothetical protein